MRFTLLLALFFALPLSAQSLGGGAYGDGHLGGGSLGGHHGIPNQVDPLDCMPPAFIDLDADAVLVGDGANAVLFNSGSGGSDWDLDRSDSNNEPIFRARGSCTGVGTACVDFVGQDYLATAAAVPATWTKKIFCVVGAFPSVPSGVKYAFAWDDFASRRTLQNVQSPTLGRLYINTAGSPTFALSPSWTSICWDTTNESSNIVSIDGHAAFTVTASPTAVHDVSLSLASYSLSGLGDYSGMKIGRVVAYNADPGHDMQELSACLKHRAGF